MAAAVSLLTRYISAMEAGSSGTAGIPPSTFAASGFTENDRFIRLTMDVPGVAVQDISVELQRGVLVVRGSRVVNLGPGVRHQHKFCRRFSIDTDVVNARRIQANLNHRGVLTIMAPKMRLPTTLQIQVTQQDDDAFEASITKSFEQQQLQLASDRKNNAVACKKMQEERDEQEPKEKDGARNGVIGSPTSHFSDGLSTRSAVVNHKHKDSLQPHLMTRRSMRENRLKKTRCAKRTR